MTLAIECALGVASLVIGGSIAHALDIGSPTLTFGLCFGFVLGKILR